MKIDGYTCLVTGGGSGLGAATVRKLSSCGAKVVIFDLNVEAAESVASDTKSLAIYCDISDPDSVDTAFKELKSKVDSPRIYVNCAGIATANRIVGKEGPMPYEDFTKAININLNGTFNIIRYAGDIVSHLDPVNEYGERGVIINTASVAAYEGQLGQAAYAASKAGVVGLTLPAARELSRFGIRVNAIAPGVFATTMMMNMPQKVQDSLVESVPFPKRFGKPEEYADLVECIITNPMINGTTIRLDGALRMS